MTKSDRATQRGRKQRRTESQAEGEMGYGRRNRLLQYEMAERERVRKREGTKSILSVLGANRLFVGCQRQQVRAV